MKRTKPVPASSIDGALRPLAAEDLARIKGGASMVEYALVAVQPLPIRTV